MTNIEVYAGFIVLSVIILATVVYLDAKGKL